MLFFPMFACAEPRSVYTEPRSVCAELQSAATRSRTDSLPPKRGLSPSSPLTSLLHYFLTSLAHYPLSPLESAHPRPHPRNPCRMSTSKTSRICIKTKDFNPTRMNTSETARRAKKTKDFKSTRMNTSAISQHNPFRIRTSKKVRGGRGVGYKRS